LLAGAELGFCCFLLDSDLGATYIPCLNFNFILGEMGKIIASSPNSKLSVKIKREWDVAALCKL
jgi:hypothetical protein